MELVVFQYRLVVTVCPDREDLGKNIRENKTCMVKSGNVRAIFLSNFGKEIMLAKQVVQNLTIAD